MRASKVDSRRGCQSIDIQIDQQFVSRHHALILAGPNQTVIEDLRSTNGVLVNGQRLRRSVLADGDVILIGKTKFRFARRPRSVAAKWSFPERAKWRRWNGIPAWVLS